MQPQAGGAPRVPTGSIPALASGPPGGLRIGRYDLLRRLGAGGMAEVHLARATGFEGFEKLLVLKRILPHLAADAHFVKMFLAEARLAALLQHPNVVQVYDLGQEDTHFFFTMELVYGENAYAITQAAARRRETFPIEHAITIAIGAAAGLHYAHERVGFDGRPLGIVHRDVSPTNLMVTYDGCPKVADFGIAKITTRTDVTQAGIRKGKVPYMSPEQCKAKRVDRRSDVFALGICLYELSTQTRLFDGDNEFGVMNRIVTGDIPPPSSRRSGYPKALERIVMKALSVDPQRRYPSAQAMQLELETMVREQRLDASQSSLATWMRRVFRPQPFPWGALQGDGVKGGGAMPTQAGSGASAGGPASQSDLTPLSDLGMALPSSGVSGLVSRSSPMPRSRVTKAGQRTETLKGVAMGLGMVAALAVASVGGMYVYMQTKVTEAEARAEEPAAAGKPAVAQGAPVAEPAAVVDPVEAVAVPAVVAEVPTAAVGGQPVAAAAEPAVAEAPEEPEPEPEIEIEIEPDPEPKPKPAQKAKPRPSTSTTKPKPKPKPAATKKKPAKPPKEKKPSGGDADGFWGG